MHSKHLTRKPDLLIILILLAWIGVFISTAAAAEDTLLQDVDLFANKYLAELVDGDVQVAGNHHNGMHLTAKSPTASARYVSQHGGPLVKDSGVHLSWKVSW